MNTKVDESIGALVKMRIYYCEKALLFKQIEALRLHPVFGAKAPKMRLKYTTSITGFFVIDFKVYFCAKSNTILCKESDLML